MPASLNSLRVFVHLAFGYDATAWNRKWRERTLVGFNEPFPYGYHLANHMGCEVIYSKDFHENMILKVLRLVLRVVLGFDFVHAWRNRKEVLASEVIWTHTESQFLSLALLLKLVHRQSKPLLLGQSVWLMDKWSTLLPFRKLFYRWLIREVDILTFHSPLNLKLGEELFGARKCKLIRFGICCSDISSFQTPNHNGRIRLLAVGNDRHRDWETLIKAFANRPQIDLQIVSHTIPKRLIAGCQNISVRRASSQDELVELYRWSDVAVLPLRPNLHASGISCLQEAILAGKPVVATRCGGLEAYFGDDEIIFVAQGRPEGLVSAVSRLANDPSLAKAMVDKAQTRMGADGLGSSSFVRAHVDICREFILERQRDASLATNECKAIRHTSEVF